MLDVPALAAGYHLQVVPPEGAYLVSERGAVVLKGERNCRLLPLIDGVRTVDDIVDALAATDGAAEIYYALELLRQGGYVVEATPAIPAARAAFYQAVGVEAGLAERRRRERPVALAALGEVTTEPLARVLADTGLRVAPEGDLAIVLVDDYLQPGLADVNAAALATGRPWLLVQPVGLLVWVGPVFQPGVTGCWRCLAQRLDRNREVESFLQRRAGRAEPLRLARAHTASTVHTALHLAATEALRWLVRGEAARSDGVVVTLDTLSAETKRHVLVRRPQCPACGDGAHTPARAPGPVELRPGVKRFVADGGHRIASPAATVAKYGKHVSPITGAVTGLVPVAGEDDVLHNYVAGHNFALDGLSLPALRKGLRSKSAGKGVTDAQARASALCEAIERYSGIFAGDEVRTRATLSALGDRGIHPNACMLFSDRQYARREAWNARDTRFHVVPEPFDPDAELEWSPVWSLTRKDFRLLPTGYLYYGYPRAPGERFFFFADSNGNAAGNSLEEAILQGFMELVERDAVAVWWYNRLRRPAVDLESYDLPYLRELQAHYRTLARELWVLDLTSDLGIPAFAAVSRRTDKPVEDIVVAFGAHFDPRIALLRAVTEMNQFLPAVLPIAADGSGTYGYDDPEALAWWRTATAASQPYLVPDPARPPRRCQDYPRAWGDDLRDDVLACQALVEARGMELLVLDQTRPDLELPVAKVIVPGLRHFWARFAPGRLYDVPVRLGWLPAPLAEDGLNPIPVFV